MLSNLNSKTSVSLPSALSFHREYGADERNVATAYQMDHMSYAEQSDNLAGPIALLKAYATRVAHDISDHTVQIFGGRALTKGGMGAQVELFKRGYKFDAILGGSEEVLADLGVRQYVRKMPKAVL